MSDHLARKVRWQRLPRWLELGLDDGPLCVYFIGSLRGLSLFQLQFELLKLNLDLLALRAEEHATQLFDDQLQVFDLLGMGIETLTLRNNQSLQGFDIQLIEVSESGGNHGSSMP